MRPKVHIGQQQNVTATQIPASIKGINAVVSLARMDIEECVYCFNILPEDFGKEVRDGYVEWANGWTGDFARTVIAFEGNTDADDKLWVANSEGIFDVTIEGETSPAQVVSWVSSADNAGICSYVNYSNDGDARFLLLCDGENGYYIWEQETDTWEKIVEGVAPGEIDGTDPNDFNFITIWKQRIWFVQRDSGNAWYMESPGTITGDVVQFNFSDQFRFGGPLISLHNWTLDGGNGIDDHLVAISGSGDVVVYAGTDPASESTFGLVGSWYVGELPAGNRVATEFSGELYVLSVQGLLPLSNLLNGSGVETPDTYVSAKISPYIRAVMDRVRAEFGWHIHIHPKQSLLYINSPQVLGRAQVAFTMYFGTRSWGVIRGLEKSHTANWQGEVYWTDKSQNRIYIQKGNVDAVFLDQEADGLPQGIDWSVLTAYSTLGAPAQYKRVQYIRPMFVASADPAFNVNARFDFDITESDVPPSFTGGSSALWDDVTALWDTSTWGGSIKASDNPRGAVGMGRNVAISVRGRTGEATTLVAFDITYDAGGYM